MAAPTPSCGPQRPSPVLGLALVFGASVALGGGVAALMRGHGHGAAARRAVTVASVPLPDASVEPGDAPQAAVPAPTSTAPEPPATRPRTTTPPRRRTTTNRVPAPTPPAIPSPTPPVTTTAPTTTAPLTPPLTPYVPPPTVRVPVGGLPDADAARTRLAALADTAGGTERRDISWVLQLDRRFGAADQPAGRRATADLALRANAWWFASHASPDRRMVMRAPDGLLLTYREGEGFVVNPVATAGRWRGLNNDVSATDLASALLELAVPHTAGDRRFLAWEYYDVPDEPGVMRPGVSGMAQGRLAELMGTAYQATGEARFADATAGAVAALTVPVDRGGALSMVRLDGWAHPGPWYVERAYPGEDPWKGGALNGFMVTLLELRNAAVHLDAPRAAAAAATTGTTPTPVTATTTAAPATPTAPSAPSEPAPAQASGLTAALARSLADRGARTLKAALPAHDTGDWSLYGLLTPGHAPRSYRADLNYHCYHVYLLRALAAAYPALGFATWADRWQADVDARGLTCPAR
ncbi:MAG: D-glucuronyl C5-epimerase family protein [Thermoleophilia bacterium]